MGSGSHMTDGHYIYSNKMSERFLKKSIRTGNKNRRSFYETKVKPFMDMVAAFYQQNSLIGRTWQVMVHIWRRLALGAVILIYCIVIYLISSSVPVDSIAPPIAKPIQLPASYFSPDTSARSQPSVTSFQEEDQNNHYVYENEPFHQWLSSHERLDTLTEPALQFTSGPDIQEAISHQSSFVKRYGDIHNLQFLHDKSLAIQSALDGIAPIINGPFEEVQYSINNLASSKTDINNETALDNCDIQTKTAAGGEKAQTTSRTQPQRESPRTVGASGDRSMRRASCGNCASGGGGGDDGKKPPGGGGGCNKRIGGCAGSPEKEKRREAHQEENEGTKDGHVDQVIDGLTDADKDGHQRQEEQANQTGQGVTGVDTDGHGTNQQLQSPIIQEARNILSTLQCHTLDHENQHQIRFRVVQWGTDEDSIFILDAGESRGQYSDVSVWVTADIHQNILELERLLKSEEPDAARVKDTVDKIKKIVFCCGICLEDCPPDIFSPALFFKCGHSFWDACRFGIRYCPQCRNERSCVVYFPEDFRRAFNLKSTTSKLMKEGIKKSVQVGIKLQEENALVRFARGHLLSMEQQSDDATPDRPPVVGNHDEREEPRGPPRDMYHPPIIAGLELLDGDNPEEEAELDGRPVWNFQQANDNEYGVPNRSPPHNNPVGDFPNYQTDNNMQALREFLSDRFMVTESPPQSDEEEPLLGAVGGLSLDEGVEQRTQGDAEPVENLENYEDEDHREEEENECKFASQQSTKDSGLE